MAGAVENPEYETAKITRGPDLAWWWFPVFALFVVHNLEEIVFDLPAWGRRYVSIAPTSRLDQTGIALVILAMCLVFFAIAWAARRHPSITRALLLLFLGAMMLVFVGHVVASMVTLSVQPGVVTAVLLLPVYVWLFLKVQRR